MNRVNGSRPSEHEFAKLARTHRIPFDQLVERYERGLRGEELLESAFILKGDEWMSTQEASDYLGVSGTTISTANRNNATWCTRRPWSKNAKHPNGCGALYRRLDVEFARDLMRKLDLPFALTTRVIAAANAGRIDIRIREAAD